jgi:hypothetical protein
MIAPGANICTAMNDNDQSCRLLAILRNTNYDKGREATTWRFGQFTYITLSPNNFSTFVDPDNEDDDAVLPAIKKSPN